VRQQKIRFPNLLLLLVLGVVFDVRRASGPGSINTTAGVDLMLAKRASMSAATP
jgi:hypothetical protein